MSTTTFDPRDLESVARVISDWNLGPDDDGTFARDAEGLLDEPMVLCHAAELIASAAMHHGFFHLAAHSATLARNWRHGHSLPTLGACRRARQTVEDMAALLETYGLRADLAATSETLVIAPADSPVWAALEV